MPLFNLAWSPSYAWDGSQPRIRDPLVAADSTFDRALRGAAELTAEEQRRFELFATEFDPTRASAGRSAFIVTAARCSPISE